MHHDRRWLALVALLLPFAAGAQAPPPQEGITLRGILAASVYVQDALFAPGNGEQALFVSDELDEWWHGGDVRNMRIGLDFAGPEIMPHWRANGTFEMDFFGPFAAGGNFGDEQPTPRLRLAYADLTNGRTTFRVGQAWSLLLGNIAVSPTHIGFPLGWGSGGFIGWRFPGVWIERRLSADGAATTTSFAAAVMRGSWSDEPTPPDGPSAGEAGIPQLEARFNVQGKTAGGAAWRGYLVGHYDQKDLTGVTPKGDPEPPSNTLDGWAGEAGLRVDAARVTVQGNAYTGRAMGHQFASIIQFGDIASWGAWGQVGVNLTPHWSVWGYAGTDDPNDDDVRGTSGASRLQSVVLAPMLRFKAGPYALGLEWLHNRVTYVSGADSEDRSGNSVSFSVQYDFSMKLAGAGAR